MALKTRLMSCFATLLICLSFFFLPQVALAQNLPDVALEHIPVCTVGNPNIPRCHARVVTDHKGKPLVTTAPTGLSPQQLRAAYNLPTTTSVTRTIAIVDAFDQPNILSDLNVYSTQFGLPTLTACPVSSGTPANPCFEKVDQRGGTTYPSSNGGWGLEISLDVEMAHAICQNCNILLVEADDNYFSSLMAAVDRAVAMGAYVVSNSYGAREFSSETFYDSHFNIPGVAMTVSSGDSGYGTEYPAASRYVTATGGTTLTMSGVSFISETAWSGAGSGCSSYETKPSWQKDTGCGRRTIADVSAVANPNTGVSVYDTLPYSGQVGWFKVGGTSVAAPIIAGVYALQGDVTTSSAAASLPYGRTQFLRDITSGQNGYCGFWVRYLCRAQAGYDGPTGLGSPLGINAF